MPLSETYVPLAQAKGRLVELVKNVKESGDTVALTKDGAPEAVLLSYERFDSLVETMEILADRELMRQIEQSKKDVEAGRLVDFDLESD